MAYESRRPTKEKSNLFSHLEKQEKKGYVSNVKLEKYTKQKGLKLSRIDKLGWRSIKSKRGVPIAAVHVKKKKIDNWMVK